MKTQRTFTLNLFALSLTCCLAAALAPVSATWANSQPPYSTVRVSVSSTGVQGNGNSNDPSLANYGRFVAFTSEASNLVPGDHNGVSDIFVHDLKTRRTKRTSVSSTGVESNGGSGSPLISANGRYVVFLSVASNLVEGDNNGETDIFVHDRNTGVTRRVFLDGSVYQDPVFERYIDLTGFSDNGRFVAFFAGNYPSEEVFVSDLKTGVSQKMGSSEESGFISPPALSGNGRFVAFVSPCLGKDNPTVIYLHDLKTGVNQCLATSYNMQRYDLTLSADGRFLASSNYDFGTQKLDVFVEDINTLVEQLVSVNRSGAVGNNASFIKDLSANGRFVAFDSLASDLVDRDSNDAMDVFVRDLKTGVTRLVSVNSTWRQGNNSSYGASISANGHLVAFTSDASNLVKRDTNGKRDVFVHFCRR